MPATTIDQYLQALPDDRRQALAAIRKVIRDNLDPDFEEGIQYGMIGYYVPHRVFPPGYHCDPKQPLPFASLASQKSHMALYLMCVYGDPKEEKFLRERWAKTGKKLDMGKSCIRFKKLDDVPLEVIGEVIRRTTAKAFIARYEATRPEPKTKKAAPSKAKPAAKKAAAPAKKKPAARKQARA